MRWKHKSVRRDVKGRGNEEEWANVRAKWKGNLQDTLCHKVVKINVTNGETEVATKID